MDEPEPTRLTLRNRGTTSVTLSVPVDVLAQLERIATARDMSVEALLRLYIGSGLRGDSSSR
jgi:hypothetical protein